MSCAAKPPRRGQARRGRTVSIRRRSALAAMRTAATTSVPTSQAMPQMTERAAWLTGRFTLEAAHMAWIVTPTQAV